MRPSEYRAAHKRYRRVDLVLVCLPLLAACEEEYQTACQVAVLANNPVYETYQAGFDFELDQKHFLADDSRQSVTVYYLVVETPGLPAKRVRIACFANTAGNFVFASINDPETGRAIIGADGETLPERPPVNP